MGLAPAKAGTGTDLAKSVPNPSQIPVGTPLAGRPPDGSRRAELPHRALASGPNAQLPAVSAPTPLTGRAGPVSGPRGLEANCPWPAPFPRPAPPAARPGDLGRAGPHRLCSQASAVLWGRQTSRHRSSPSYSLGIHGADRLAISQPASGGISQFLPGEPTCVHGVCDRAGAVGISR